VLKATTYFQMCHFDRVRKTLETFFAIYEPMSEDVKRYLEGDLSDADFVDLVVQGRETFPEQVRLRVIGNRKFQRYLGQLNKADSELERARTEFPDGNFKGQLIGLLEDLESQWTSLVGRLAKDLVLRQSAALEDFLNQSADHPVRDGRRRTQDARGGQGHHEGTPGEGAPPSSRTRDSSTGPSTASTGSTSSATTSTRSRMSVFPKSSSRVRESGRRDVNLAFPRGSAPPR
jgi:hypothetical protein